MRRLHTAYRVFISSSSADAGLASALLHKLREIGVEVFSFRGEMKMGTRTTEALYDQLRKSDEVVFLLSDRALGSNWISAEMGAAFALKKLITPVILSDKEPNIPYLKDRKLWKYSDFMHHLDEIEHSKIQAILREPVFSRLSGVKQLGIAGLVYPSGQAEKIYRALGQGSMTTKEVAKATGISPRTASKYLSMLRKTGIVDVKQTTLARRSKTYKLKAKMKHAQRMSRQ